MRFRHIIYYKIQVGVTIVWYDYLIRKGWVPEFLLRRGIRRQIKGRTRADLAEESDYTINLYNKLRSSPIAIQEPIANEQHYELPSSFFELILGPQLKYSSCYFCGDVNLIAAEEAMLSLTARRAGVEDGQQILDLGCGWGSLTLYLATHFPNATITALSNSSTQKSYIENRCRELQLENVTVITGNIAEIELDAVFDRIISVEMFEHMRNYLTLFRKLKQWLLPNGALFIHIFARRGLPYLFEADDDDNFMAKYFFTGGTLPTINTLKDFAREGELNLEKSWEINGKHYQQTLESWYQKMMAQKELLTPILEETYGMDASTWWQYWRIFFIACAELFGYDDGNEWLVMHYRFRLS